LMKRFDLRALVCFGTLIFAASCWMNTSMSHDYAGDQFVVSNIVRALGQPFTIVPLSALATSILQPKDAGDGSAVFNIARNLGGSVGTAMLGTIITRREQFHDFEIGAYINAYRPVVQERVQTLATTFFNKGYDAVTATHQAFGQINDIVRREAYVMAFNDAFLIVGISLLIGAVLVWFCQKTRAQEGAVAH
jgi:DHA2 family multidrug resistance protein